jgi:EAL domain-containing protein (putative c-di-GMP-specific phosphodiesterase class I)
MMAHPLRLAVTAEGVETARQLTFLESHACDRIQGYYLAAPLTPVEMTALLADKG